jgi:SAM-dependent methyltransferase
MPDRKLRQARWATEPSGFTWQAWPISLTVLWPISLAVLNVPTHCADLRSYRQRMTRATTTQLILPSPNGADAAEQAVWTGQAFVVGTATERILSYGLRQSGWNDGLARFHRQETASDHFIEIASRAHAMKEVKRTIVETPSVILDIGCAAGYLLRELLQQLPEHVIIGSDYTLDTLQEVGSNIPSVPLLRFDLTQCPLPDDFADVVVLLNVLEHIGGEEQAVAHLFRILRPGGVAIIEVPAKAALFDIFDRVLMHFRRYDMQRLTQLLRKAGFTIERRSHLGFFLFPAFYVSKRLNQLRHPARPDVDEMRIVSKMISTARSSSLMRYTMAAESALRQYVYLPFGIRCLVTCRKCVSR